MIQLVGPEIIDREDSWSPLVYCGRLFAMIASGSGAMTEISDVQVLEGERLWGDQPDVPVYRSSHVGEFELLPEAEHLAKPAKESLRSVRPGDLVVTKAGPVRAAIVSPAAYRHGVDAHCYIIRGLAPADLLWFAMCVNQPDYSEYLLRKSGGSIVRRLMMNVLKSARYPRPVEGVELLTKRAMGCLDDRLQSRAALAEFQRKVHDEVSSAVPSGSRLQRLADDSEAWGQFFDAAAIEDTWLPWHVAANAYQNRLEATGWSRLNDLLSNAVAGGERYRGKADVRTLQLSDVGEDLRVIRGEFRPDVGLARRVYAEPVRENEVLLSSLTTYPRVAFAAVAPEEDVRPTDHWHRLRFRETPGAWAMVLNTPQIQRQLARLGVGTIREFTAMWTVRRLVLPDIPLETRRRWDSFARKWQAQHRELEREWCDILSEGYSLLRKTHREFGAWTVPPKSIRDRGRRHDS